MKKQFNVFDGFTVALFYLFMENRVTVWVILLPYAVDILAVGLKMGLTYFGVPDRLKFSIWKFFVNREVKKGAEKAKSKILRRD